MSSMIYTPMAADADRARKQREEPEAWHLPHMSKRQHCCTGNCEQGRFCDCAVSAPIQACPSSLELGLVDPQSAQDAELLVHMFKLLSAIVLACLLAWALG